MLPDRVSNPGPLTYESEALPIVLRGPVIILELQRYTVRCVCNPFLVTTFPEWLSGKEPYPRTPGAVRLSSLCL